MEEEPKDVMVLNAIASGHDTEKKIAKATRLSAFEVASVIERLILAGFIYRMEKKGFLGTKNVLKITEKGMRELQERRYELEQRWQKMVMFAQRGDKQQFEQALNMNRSWLPLMMFMGIMDMMMWMSMLSMMGIAAHTAMPEGYDMGEGADADSYSGDGAGDFGDLGDISF